MTSPRSPCPSCPWRRTSPPGAWSREQFRQIRDRCLERGIRTMTCHEARHLPFEQWPRHACRGWSRVVGEASPGVRILLGAGFLDPGEVGSPPANLYASFREMLEHNGLAADDLGAADQEELEFAARVIAELGEGVPGWSASRESIFRQAGAEELLRAAGVPDIEAPLRERIGSCYGLALRFFFEAPREFEGRVLVHGYPRLRGGQFRGALFGHAWIELDGKSVWDPIEDRFFDKQAYYGLGRIDPSWCKTWRDPGAVLANLRDLGAGNWAPEPNSHGEPVLFKEEVPR